MAKIYKDLPFLDLVWKDNYRLTLDVRKVPRSPTGQLYLPQGFTSKDDYENENITLWGTLPQLPPKMFDDIFPDKNIKRLDLFEVEN